MFAPGEYAKTKALVKNMAMRLMKVPWLEGAGEVWGSESCRDFHALMCLASHALAVQPSIPKHDVLEDCSEMLTNARLVLVDLIVLQETLRFLQKETQKRCENLISIF